MANDPLTLQATRGQADRFALYPQHIGDELMSHLQCVRLCPVLRHRKPAAEALLDRMQAVAAGCLRDLRNLRLSLPE
jgi:hypothetical protein